MISWECEGMVGTVTAVHTHTHTRCALLRCAGRTLLVFLLAQHSVCVNGN